jgi:hypothetical protein
MSRQDSSSTTTRCRYDLQPNPTSYQQALKFISENAVKGIGPKDVAAHLGISAHRLFEMSTHNNTPELNTYMT